MKDGCGFLFVRYKRHFCTELISWEHVACPLSGIKRRPLVGGWLKGGRVMIAFFVNYSTIAFPLHLPTLKRQQFFGAVANSLGKNSYFPLPLDVRRYVAPTGEEVDARQRRVN